MGIAVIGSGVMGLPISVNLMRPGFSASSATYGDVNE